jgi:hypothetical protein
MAALFISNYHEVGDRYLKPYLEECLLQNSLPYYTIICLLIEGIQINWPYSTFANIASPSTEAQMTIMNDIMISKDPSRSFVVRLNLNQSVRHLFSYLVSKSDLNKLEIKLTYNHH